MVKKIVVVISVIAAIVIAGGLGVLIWWLVSGSSEPFTVIELNSDAIGDVEGTAALTRIRDTGDMFWWFFPADTEQSTERPLVLWLDGAAGTPPSLLANFGMIGPYDFNLNKRNNSWVDRYNLLFVDAPLGTGFSEAQSDENISDNLEENIDHLMFTLEAFYTTRKEYENTALYIFGQGDGSHLALALAIRLLEDNNRIPNNLKSVLIGNGIVSPALALTKLGFYMWELGYVDEKGRAAIEAFSEETNNLVNNGQLAAAFDHFLTLGDYIDEVAGAAAVNLGHIVEKLTRDGQQGYFGQQGYLDRTLGIDTARFMDETVGPALGVSSAYNARQNAALYASKATFMEPDTSKIEYILQNSAIRMVIYNGNLDAVSNTPGQLEWVNSLDWPGQEEFLTRIRQTLIVDRQVQGYLRQTEQLMFYWINAAGQSVPMDSPAGMRRVIEILDRMTGY